MTPVRRSAGVAGIVLAAGAARRFGGPKLLAMLDGAPLVRHAVATLLHAGLAPVVVVTGDDDGVTGALAGLDVTVVRGAHHAGGMGTALAAGIEALPTGARAAVIAPGDIPRVPADVIPALVATWRGTGQPIVAPRYAGDVRGYPILFDSDLFPELSALEGDEGARPVILRSTQRVRLVDVPHAAPVDVDTREDLARLAVSGGARDTRR